MQDTLQCAGHIAMCRSHFNIQATLKRGVGIPAALCGTGGGSCHFFVPIFHFHFFTFHSFAIFHFSHFRALCLFLLLNVVYLVICAKLGLVVGMTKQMSNGKKVDIVNC